MKKKGILLFILIFIVIILYSKKILLLPQNKDINFPEIIKIGYFFEKNPFFYYDLSESTFKGYEIDFLRYFFNKFLKNKLENSDYIKNKNEKENTYSFKFYKIQINDIPYNLDFIIGGLIYSNYLNNITKNYIKIFYYQDNILLLRNRNFQELPFNEINKKKIKIGVKLYTKGFYLFQDIPNITKFSFYSDLLNNLNNGNLKYALIDQYDLKFVNLKNYNNISLQNAIYKEDYVILLNFKYSKYEDIIKDSIVSFKGDYND